MCYCGEDGIGSPSTAGLNYIMEFHILQVSIVNVHKCMVYECLQAFSIMGLHLLHMASCTLCTTLLEVKGHITVAISASQYVWSKMCHIYYCIVETFRRRKFHDYAWEQTFHGIYCAIFVSDICVCVLIFCVFGRRMDGVHLYCCIYTSLLDRAVGILTCDLSTLQWASPFKVLPLRYFSGWRPLLGVYFTIVCLTPMYSCSSNFDLPFRQDLWSTV